MLLLLLLLHLQAGQHAELALRRPVDLVRRLLLERVADLLVLRLLHAVEGHVRPGVLAEDDEEADAVRLPREVDDWHILRGPRLQLLGRTGCSRHAQAGACPRVAAGEERVLREHERAGAAELQPGTTHAPS